MPLAKLQAELAALLMEPGRLDRFAQDPAGYARKAGLTGKDASLLAGLQVEGARYFASRRRIDRHGYLRSDLPNSVRHLSREGGMDLYFATHPYAFEDPIREVARLGRWARAATRAGKIPVWLGDVIRVETAAVLLLHTRHRAASPSKRPKRAPGIKLVRVHHDPEHFLHEHDWIPEPGAFTVVLQRTADDVENPVLKPSELALLKAANGKRTSAQLIAHVIQEGHTKARATAGLARLRKLRLVA